MVVNRVALMVDSKDGTGVGEKEQALTGLLIWNLGLNNTASIEACSPQPPELIELPYDADSAGCFNAHAYGAIPSTPERFSRRSSVAKAPVRMQRSRAVSPVSQKAGKKGAGAKKAATTVTKEHHQVMQSSTAAYENVPPSQPPGSCTGSPSRRGRGSCSGSGWVGVRQQSCLDVDNCGNFVLLVQTVQ